MQLHSIHPAGLIPPILSHFSKSEKPRSQDASDSGGMMQQEVRIGAVRTQVRAHGMWYDIWNVRFVSISLYYQLNNAFPLLFLPLPHAALIIALYTDFLTTSTCRLFTIAFGPSVDPRLCSRIFWHDVLVVLSTTEDGKAVCDVLLVFHGTWCSLVDPGLCSRILSLDVWVVLSTTENIEVVCDVLSSSTYIRP